MRLSAQAIRFYAVRHNMITPFNDTKVVVNGKSAGLSSASYDMTIGHDITLGVNPGYILRDHILDGYGIDGDDSIRLRTLLRKNPPFTALAHTNEDLLMPHDVDATVKDKSSYARVFCSAFNTYIDPGFHGNLTLELVNHGPDPVVIRAGDPIVQLLFNRLDHPTDRPYGGKYQHQTKASHPARHEAASPSGVPRPAQAVLPATLRDECFLSPAQAAAVLNVSLATVRRLDRSGKLPFVNVSPRRKAIQFGKLKLAAGRRSSKSCTE